MTHRANQGLCMDINVNVLEFLWIALVCHSCLVFLHPMIFHCSRRCCWVVANTSIIGRLTVVLIRLLGRSFIIILRHTTQVGMKCFALKGSACVCVM